MKITLPSILLFLVSFSWFPIFAQDSSIVTFAKTGSEIENMTFHGTMVMDKKPSRYGWYLKLDAPLTVLIKKGQMNLTSDKLELDVEDFDRKDEDWNGIHLQA